MVKTRLLGLVAAAALIGVVVGGSILAVNQQNDYSALLLQMRSAQWQQRADAVMQVLAKPEALQSEQVKKALIDLLDRENQLIEATLRESGGQEGVSVKYGEEYSEYYSGPLSEAVEKVADYNDKHTLEVLVRSAYNYDSPFALKLASYGEAVVPALLARAASDVSASRADAVGLLGQIVSKHGDSITEASKQKIKQTLLKNVSNQDPVVQGRAIKALGEVGDKDALPILEKIAKPGLTPSTDAKPSPLQKKAKEAIQAIKQREPGN